MTSVIVGIHGLANKPDRQTLSKWWETSIREGLKKNCGIDDADFQYILVHWADLLHPEPQHEGPPIDELHTNQPYIEARPGALKEYTQSWLDSLRARVSSIVGGFFDKIGGWVGLRSAARVLVGLKVKDLAYYYDATQRIENRGGEEESARKVLMDELMSTLLPLKGRRMMLIAHSMVTIIAYDVLRDLGQRDREFPVHHYVTIGSPLGMGTVKDSVLKERSYADVPVRTPTVVRERWVNYADRGDPVAVDTHLRDDYGPNDGGVRVEDDLIRNDYVGLDGKRKPHKSFGYLRTPELSRHIRDFLAG